MLQPQASDWVSPRLGVRFDLSGDELKIFKPNGERFLTFRELMEERDRERQEKEQAMQNAEAERRRAEALAERLRALGVDPDGV